MNMIHVNHQQGVSMVMHYPGHQTEIMHSKCIVKEQDTDLILLNEKRKLLKKKQFIRHRKKSFR